MPPSPLADTRIDMSNGTQSSQSVSYAKPSPVRLADNENHPLDYPPITSEDLVKLGVEPRFISSLVSATQWAEQYPNGPPLNTTEAEDIVEILDKVCPIRKPPPRAKTPGDQLVSSSTANPSLKIRCLRVLRKLSPSQGILPKSYHPGGVTLNDTTPYASGRYADIWKGRRGEVQVCVKAFQTRTTANLNRIKRVCCDSDEDEFILTTASGSTVR